MQTYLQLSKKINDELLNRDLTDISTDTLLKMSIANDNRLNEIVKDKSFEVGVPSVKVLEYSSDPDNYFCLKADE